jgi:hypothetical protein
VSRTIRVLAIALPVLLAAHAAAAYPQYQLSRDQTCAGCHLSPAGGGLLSENGRGVAETSSQWGTAPEFLYGKVSTPDWLTLGGDLRGAAGLDAAPFHRWVRFPMQAELYANATVAAFSLYVNAGLRDPQLDTNFDPPKLIASTLFATREHWLQWQQRPGEATGLFVRAGRFMPVFGLRFAEHVDYTRRYGGTPLYGEAYGVAVEDVEPGWEVHATAFIHDPLRKDSVERGTGAALYAEARLDPITAVGVEAKVDVTADDRHLHGGLTAKRYLAGPGILLQAEVQLIQQKVYAGGYNHQAIAYLMGSYFLGDAVMIDVGLSAYEPDTAVRYLDREALDVNAHFFATSHLELILTNRFEMLELGEGGKSSGYSLVQLHYRL